MPETAVMPANDMRLVEQWHVNCNLDNYTFTYRGRSVPGRKLAELLGLVEEEAETAVR